MDEITIPVNEPITFDRLRELNPRATVDDLADAFGHLPPQLREQAWEHLRLRVALENWTEPGERGDPEAGP